MTALPRPEDIPPAEARVREAESALNDAKVNLSLMENVTDKRAIREEELSRRRFAVQAAEARLEEAQAQLSLLKAGAWRHDLEVARTEVDMAEAQVSRTKTDIERLTVRSPVSGVILQSNVRAGEYAQTGPLGTPLMLVGSVGSLHVRVDVDENDAWRVKEGASAEASVRGNAQLKGPLSFVRFEPYVIPKRSLSGSVTERVDTRVLQVIYRLEPNAFPVYVGQQVDVFIKGGRQ
jgi:multidrug resistance efflux pump